MFTLPDISLSTLAMFAGANRREGNRFYRTQIKTLILTV